MPPKIKDKFTRENIPRSTKSFLRKKEAWKQNGAGKRTPEMFAAEKLEPLIAWSAKNPGTTGKPSNAPDYVASPYNRIQAEFARHSRTVPTIDEFKRWLHKDAERTQCRYGVGLILERVYRVLSGKEL